MEQFVYYMVFSHWCFLFFDGLQSLVSHSVWYAAEAESKWETVDPVKH